MSSWTRPSPEANSLTFVESDAIDLQKYRPLSDPDHGLCEPGCSARLPAPKPSDPGQTMVDVVAVILDTYKDKLLAETREELAKADAKASILLAASGIAFLALLTVGSAGSWYPDKLSHHAARIADWLSILFVLVGICFVAAAVKPRLRERHSETPKPFFFGDVAAYRPPWYTVRHRHDKLERAHAAFVSELERMTESDVSSRVSDQIWQLSYIAYLKYRLLAIGIWCFAGGVVAAAVALMVEKQWL